MFPQLRFALTFSLLVTSTFGSPASRQRARGVGPTETISIRVSEGTDLGFDLSPDGRSIVFDLLGQLWLVPAQGGEARPITDSVRDTAEDFDPTFAPDGRRVVFRGERNGRTGLWQLSLISGVPQQLTQLSDPDGFDGDAAWSPTGRAIAFLRAVPGSSDSKWRSAIMLLDVASRTVRELPVKGIPSSTLRAPVWVHGGTAIAFIVSTSQGERGGRVWMVAADGGAASPITGESVQAHTPSFSADGRHVAYFASDSAGRTQVWVQEVEGNNIVGAPLQLTNQTDVTPTRIRWFPNGSELLYSANGRLWKVSASGGPPTEIPFTVAFSFRRMRRELPPARFPEPGRKESARGFMGLSLSPDGSRIGLLALGKLWIVPIGASPQTVTDVPLGASSLAWSPNGREVAYSAGVVDQEDLFTTDLKTGITRRITSLQGREAFPVYSPDGRYLAFVHVKEDGVLRVIDANAHNVTETGQTRDLGSIGLNWTTAPQWSPESDGLLVCGPAKMNQPGRASFVPLAGQRQTVAPFPDAPIFLQWTAQHKIVFVRHDRLWQAPFDRGGMLSQPKPVGTDAALYASASRDGALLFVSDGGLQFISPDGKEKRIGWPVSYTPPTAEAMLIRNVRIIDGKGELITTPRDILIERGRITRIGASGSISPDGVHVLDAAGRIAIPGLMDLHAHTYRPDLLPGFLYFGITTVRDQGSSMAPLVSYADDIAAGVLPGPRVGYGGFQFYSDWPFDEEQGRGIEPEADPDHVRRSVALAQAFGAQHIKTRTFRRWDINARMITEAHRRGMRATGHCSQQLSLVAAGMDAKEHTGLCEARGDTHIYDDLVQLFRAAGTGVIPTIIYREFAVRLNERPSILDDDAELAPFLPARENFDWMIKLTPQARFRWTQDAQLAREATAKLWRAGVIIGTGTDIWQIPTGVHSELEQLVGAGLTPLQAIKAGTGDAARILGADKDLGTIEVGKWADLILLDANPLGDIRNTRRIWQVVHNGQLVDRPAILKTMKPR